jgi:hypothetical protein
MLIRFVKSRGDGLKPHAFSCQRANGSATWTREGEGMIRHDLIHHAVETTLGWPETFYGLVARGYDVTDFDGLVSEWGFVPAPEAGHAEFIVALLQAEFASGSAMPDFADQLRAACANAGVQAPEIAPEALSIIRAKARDLLARWEALKPGEALELVFEG